jgi:fructose-1,6-bisphosphatase/inositol monophosphatase family enzyme
MSSHGAWDYMASVHICIEAGVSVGELGGRDLIVTQHGERRSPVVAATPALFEQARLIRELV